MVAYLNTDTFNDEADFSLVDFGEWVWFGGQLVSASDTSVDSVDLPVERTIKKMGDGDSKRSKQQGDRIIR